MTSATVLLISAQTADQARLRSALGAIRGQPYRLEAAGTLDKYNVKLIGASIKAIKVAEDRQLFKDAMRDIGLDVPQSGLARSLAEATDLLAEQADRNEQLDVSYETPPPKEAEPDANC